MAFIFGGDTGLTPEEVKRKRDLARAILAARRTPRNVGEGLDAIGKAIAARVHEGRANKAERSGREEFTNLFGDYFDGTAEAPAAPSQARAASAVPSSSAGEPQELETYIRKAAADRGIDPNTAVKVARAEGLAPGVWQSNVIKNGAREPSYGPFQLLVGGEGTGFPTGLGNEFMQSTGLDPRDQSTAYQQIDFALDQARKGGWSPWYGASRVGVNEWEGINKNPIAQALGSAQGGQRRPSGIDPKLMAIIEHPSFGYASEAHKTVIGALLKQQMEANQPPDPVEQARLRNLQLRNKQLAEPGVTTVISPEEAEQLGLPPGSYQRGPQGKIMQIGGRNMTVSLPAPPQHYTYNDPMDPSKGVTVIPGSPADIKQREAAAAAEQEQQEASKREEVKSVVGAEGANVVLDATKEIKNLIDTKSGFFDPVTGTGSRITAWWSSSDAGKLRSYVKPITSGVAIQTMMRLKEASSTGATGFGQLNRSELELLVNAMGSLDPDRTDPAIFRKTITDIEDRYNRVVKDIRKNVTPERIKELGLEPLLRTSEERKTEKGMPEGIDPKVWDELTPEERALWQTKQD